MHGRSALWSGGCRIYLAEYQPLLYNFCTGDDITWWPLKSGFSVKIAVVLDALVPQLVDEFLVPNVWHMLFKVKKKGAKALKGSKRIYLE